ncbi:MAG: hypothetical protein LBF08_06240, partial [Dysgonamonadaceae bacterium]|nr:hypothetical protein [Dysgonamonadaceae bacterium]
MKKFILSLSILFIGFIAKGARYLGEGTHYIVDEWYPNGTTLLVEANTGRVTIHLKNTYINFRGKNAAGEDKDREPCIDILHGNQV